MKSRAAMEIETALAQPSGSITDAETSMAFPAVAAALTELAGIFDRAGIAPDDCASLGCDNSVASAVVLLALVAAGRNFVLLPRQGGPADKAIAAPVSETFCRLALQAGRRGHAEGAIDLETADISVAIAPKPGWRANLAPGPASYFLPTSGSTGRAKLVRHAHDRFLPGGANVVERLGLVSSDRIAVPVPLSHMYGLRAAFAPGLVAGAAMDLQANSNALRFLSREKDFDPNIAFLTPSFGNTLLGVRKSARPYRLTVMSGDGLAPDLFEKYESRHGRVVNLYGSTELGAVAAGDPEDPFAIRRDAIGPFLSGASLCKDIPAPPEGAEPPNPNLLWFRHDFGFLCYIDAEGREVLAADGSRPSGDSFCSGDIGRVVDGYLTVTGRGDDNVKRDGVFVACGEVAAAVRTLEGLEQVVVFAGDMTRRGRALVAFCVPAAKDRWDAAALRRAALDILPPHAVPDYFFLLPEMPCLPTGKVDRPELRRLYAASTTGEK